MRKPGAPNTSMILSAGERAMLRILAAREATTMTGVVRRLLLADFTKDLPDSADQPGPAQPGKVYQRPQAH
jgi:hypothetical protein